MHRNELAVPAVCTSVAIVTHQYFDADTGLLTRLNMPVKMGEQKAQMEITLRDYRVVGGIKTPFTIETKMSESISVRVEMTEVQWNGELPESAFNLPEDIQELVKTITAAGD